MNSTINGFSYNTFFSVAFSYGLTVNLPANSCVLWLILREARLSPDIFYFSLSVEEILVSLLNINLYLYYHYNCIPCFEACMFFRGLFFTARPLFQSLICLECYLGVNHPVLFLRLKPLRYRLTCCALSWLLVSVFCVYNQFISSSLHHLFTFFIQNLLLLAAVLFCLVSVLQTLKRPGPGGNSAQKKSNRSKSRAFRILSVTMAIMTVNFLLCMLPIPLLLCLPEWKFMLVFTICTFMAFATGFMQPLIYLQRAEKILCLRLH